MALVGDEILAPTRVRKDLAVIERSVDHCEATERVLKKRELGMRNMSKNKIRATDLVLTLVGEDGDFGLIFSPGMRTRLGVRMMSDTLKGNLKAIGRLLDLGGG